VFDPDKRWDFNAGGHSAQPSIADGYPVISTVFRERRKSTHLPEWRALSGPVYAHEAKIATFEFQKLVESGTSRLRNVFRFSKRYARRGLV
jgi:hypothetical protein